MKGVSQMNTERVEDNSLIIATSVFSRRDELVQEKGSTKIFNFQLPAPPDLILLFGFCCTSEVTGI